MIHAYRGPLIVATILAAALIGPDGGEARAGETLDRVRQSGELRCGVSENGPGLATVDSAGRWTGFWPDLCRAVGAATAGDADAVRFVPLANPTRFAALRDNAIDLLSDSATWTLGREAGTGLLFADTVLYDGQAFLAHADNKAPDLKSVGAVRVCVDEASTSMHNVQDLAQSAHPNLTVMPFNSLRIKNESFYLRKCDLLTSDRTALAAARLTFGADINRFVLLPDIISKEPLSLVVRNNDPDWFNVVRWTHFVLVTAEEKGITAANLHSFLTSGDPEIRRLLGLEGGFGTALGLDEEWARRAIRAVGNYGELYNRHLGPDTPMGLERGLNELWAKGGLIYAPPIR